MTEIYIQDMDVCVRHDLTRTLTWDGNNVDHIIYRYHPYTHTPSNQIILSPQSNHTYLQRRTFIVSNLYKLVCSFQIELVLKLLSWFGHYETYGHWMNISFKVKEQQQKCVALLICNTVHFFICKSILRN